VHTALFCLSKLLCLFTLVSAQLVRELGRKLVKASLKRQLAKTFSFCSCLGVLRKALYALDN